VLGAAIGSLVTVVRRRKGEAGTQAGAAEDKAAATVPSAATPAAQAEDNGSPFLRVAAGVLAVLFAVFLPVMASQQKEPWGGIVLMAVLALLFGWYAIRGRKGFPGPSK
jgi:hypothetical protein